MDKERTCNECKIIKPITEFYKRKDDYTKRCKECVCQSERLRYTIKNVENGTYECYEVGLDEIPQELSLPELKALMKQHNIPIKPHSNKPDIVEVLKQQGILPENYINGLRRCTPHAPVGSSRDRVYPSCSPPIAPTRKVSTHSVDVTGIPKRLAAQTVELTDMSDGSVTVYPSLYKAAKFLGTYNHNITKHNGLSYSYNNKMYKIRVNPSG